jgi:hypothetical protein
LQEWLQNDNSFKNDFFIYNIKMTMSKREIEARIECKVSDFEHIFGQLTEICGNYEVN